MHGAKGGPARGTLISGVPPTQILAPPGPSWPLLLAGRYRPPTSCRLHFVQTARYCAHDSERWGSTKVVLNPERSQHDVTGSGSPAYPDVTSERRAAPRRAAGRRSLSTRDVLRAGSSRSRACGRSVELKAPSLHEDQGHSGLVNCCILSTWHVGERRSSVQQSGSERDVGREESRGADPQGSESAAAKRLHPLVFSFSGIDPTLQPLVRHRLLWWPDILTSGPRNTYLDVLLKIPEQLESRQEQVTKSRRLITFCYLINLVRKLGNLLHVSRCPRHCIAPCGLQKVQPRMALCGVWHPPPQRGLHLPAMWFEKVVSHCCFDLHFLDYWLSYNLQ
ncbi:uncharacterized protein LOC112665009 [Canis lupus dingo]|uniref:uncharacterized protein LOC112665009 n=1 Tax=Canis lupus dingo TaxID=286419 RepID=UPI0020C27D7C|nr:uncharacterized protein LOC112665009 [Canis lupus dingo]